MIFAPISIPVYKRVDHLKKCIETLKLSSIASKSIIYIFSDASSNCNDESILKMRNYLKEIDGFAEVIIIEQKTNKGLKNIIEAIEIPLFKYGKVIYLEEDLEVSESFLKIMNEALINFENDEKVFSISGYALPIFKTNDIYFEASCSFNAWGCGLWDSKYKKYIKFVKSKENIFNSKKKYFEKIKFILGNGLNQYFHYKDAFKTNKLTPDLSIGHYLWQNNIYQLFPTNSLIKTNGFDGSGWNCGISDKFHSEIILNFASTKFRYDNDLHKISVNFKKIKKFHGINIYNDFKSLIKYIIKKIL